MLFNTALQGSIFEGYIAPIIFCIASEILIAYYGDGQVGDVLTNSLHSV